MCDGVSGHRRADVHELRRTMAKVDHHGDPIVFERDKVRSVVAHVANLISNVVVVRLTLAGANRETTNELASQYQVDQHGWKRDKQRAGRDQVVVGEELSAEILQRRRDR